MTTTAFIVERFEEMQERVRERSTSSEHVDIIAAILTVAEAIERMYTRS